LLRDLPSKGWFFAAKCLNNIFNLTTNGARKPKGSNILEVTLSKDLLVAGSLDTRDIISEKQNVK